MSFLKLAKQDYELNELNELNAEPLADNSKGTYELNELNAESVDARIVHCLNAIFATGQVRFAELEDIDFRRSEAIEQRDLITLRSIDGSLAGYPPCRAQKPGGDFMF